MSEFRQVSETFWASPQLTVGDVAAAAQAGFSCLINNRPDAEVDDQPSGAVIEEAAREAGLAYYAIPVTPGGFSRAQVDAMAQALAGREGKVLAFCRSGTRSTLLWALAQATTGRDLDAIARDAAGAGYDVTPIRPLMAQLAHEADR